MEDIERNELAPTDTDIRQSKSGLPIHGTRARPKSATPKYIPKHRQMDGNRKYVTGKRITTTVHVTTPPTDDDLLSDMIG